MRKISSSIVAAICLCWATIALADGPEPSRTWLDLGDASIYSNSLKALVILFVLAVLIESALAVIFNWRLFLMVFNGRGMKTLIAIVVSWFVVSSLSIDIVQQLLSAYFQQPVASTTLTTLLTALIIAGGSNGVYNILVALGYRDRRAESAAPTPPKGKAWVSVRVAVPKAQSIAVKLQPLRPVDPAAPLAIAGTIRREGFWRSLIDVFFRNRSRFPQSGGYEVVPDQVYKMEIDAKDAAGARIPCPLDGEYVFAERAIVDFYWSVP